MRREAAFSFRHFAFRRLADSSSFAYRAAAAKLSRPYPFFCADGAMRQPISTPPC